MSLLTDVTPKLGCFIHSTTLDIWKDEFLINMLNHMRDHELLKKIDHLCVVNTGIPLNVERFERDYYPAKVMNYSESTTDFENVTIKLMYAFCKYNPDYKVLYMHTKGITYARDHVFLPGIQSWIRYMMYGLIDQHEKCIRMLHIYDTIGSNYRPFEDGNGQHYSGNFWWAKASYIAKLPIHQLKNKYDPEFWLLQDRPMYFNIHTLEHMYQQIFPIEHYKQDIDNGMDENVLFCKVGFYGTGLCNQLFCIVNTLTLAATQLGSKVIILDDFISDIFADSPIPSCDVLNISRCNEMLKPYKITLMYKNHITMNVTRVLFGLRHIGTTDITDAVKTHFFQNNHLCIPKGTFLNDYTGMDPCPNMRKQIYVEYTLNDVTLHRVFSEEKLFYRENLEIKHSNYDGKPHRTEMSLEEPWLQRINRKDSYTLSALFDYFLKSMEFQSVFYEKANQFIQKIRENHSSESFSKLHVIHLRNEEDAIKHWSDINKLSIKEFSDAYNSHLYTTIENNMNKDEPIVVLTGFVEDNPVLHELEHRGYKLYVRPNEDIGREMNAIIDLLCGMQCNGTYFGNFVYNPIDKTLDGSTFSYTLFKLIESHCENTFVIDIDRIHDPVQKLT